MDNYIVSARKYRPSTFRSVVGQKSLTTTLKNAIQTNKLAHAYLFCGPRGVGKTSCARIFAKTINCQNLTPEGDACNECESCSAFNEQRSYNIHELDAASNNSVDDIRSLIEQVRIPPAIGKYKVFIIDEVHMLSSAAFNAFLKTLEEPPHHALFILATTEKHKVLPTILSRCQIYDFSRISIADIVEHLEYVASCEGATAEAEALNVIAQKADGGMRDALSIFDQVISFSGGNVTYKTVIDNLNVLDYEYYFRLTEVILSANVRSSILILNEILGKGFDGQNIITGLTSHFRDLLVCKDEETLVLFEVGASIRERYKEMAKKCPETFLYKAIELANTCDMNYRTSRNKRLLIELTLIQLCQLNNTPPDNPEKKAQIATLDNQTAQAQAQPTQNTPANAPASGAGGSPTTYNQTITTQVPHNVKITIPRPTAEPASSRPSTRFATTSLKDLTAEKPKGQVVEQTVQVQEVCSMFNEEDLIKYWDMFASSIVGKVHLKSAMTSCKPVLKDDFLFEVTVHNPELQKELAGNSAEVLSFLRDNLKNSKIQMSIHVEEAQQSHHVSLAAEKYDHMVKINPSLIKLTEEFSLRLD